jgi:hypothetical protein
VPLIIAGGLASAPISVTASPVGQHGLVKQIQYGGYAPQPPGGYESYPDQPSYRGENYPDRPPDNYRGYPPPGDYGRYPPGTAYDGRDYRGPKWRPGQVLPPQLLDRVVYDWEDRGLSRPPNGHEWVRVGLQFILVRLSDRKIARILNFD